MRDDQLVKEEAHNLIFYNVIGLLSLFNIYILSNNEKFDE